MPASDSRTVPAASVLVVLPTWVGDFVMATPILRAIRRRFDGARITFLIEPNLRDLVRGGDWMDDCVEWPTKPRRRAAPRCSVTPCGWRTTRRGAAHKGRRYSGGGRGYWKLVRLLRRRRFDWAIVLPNSFRSALIARLSGARRRIGYDRDGRGWLLTDRVAVKNRRRLRIADCGLRTADGARFSPVPLVDYYADLAEAIGCQRPGDRLELFTTPDCDAAVQGRLDSVGVADQHPLVVMSPGAKYGAAKCWIPERFAAVGDRLIRERGAAVIVTCGPGEEQIARKIGAAMGEDGLVFGEPLLSLGELKSLIKRSDLLLCNDAGPRHFAKAFYVAVVTVFGPTHPEWTRTGYEAERIVRIDVDCGPCQQRICPLGHLECMTGVTVEAVFDACAGLLDLLREFRVASASSR